MTADWKKLAQDAWDSPSWREGAAEYRHRRGNNVLIVEIEPERLKQLRRLMSDNVSLERAWHEINRSARERYNEAPEATYHAVVYELRTHGLAQLKQANCQRRLCDLSAAQIKTVIASLQQRRSQYPNVSDELLTALATIFDAKGNGQ
jgi:hypothetical protein